MRSACSHYFDGLVALSLGEASPEASAHVEVCEGCRSTLEQFITIAAGLRAEFYDAPEAVRVHAKQLLIDERPVFVARLVRSSLALTGARAENADSFQMAFEEHGLKARLMYQREGRTWSVHAQVSGAENLSAQAAGKSLDPDSEGRFSFSAKRLEDTGVRVDVEQFAVLIPAASEVSPEPSDDS